tara:strand:- start:548 stop:2962 length:2415 start_codon:yes stop_codon:yes gene_type:complete
MGTPTIIKGEEYFNTVVYEGNGGGQRVGRFVPFTDNGTIANSVLYNDDDSPYLTRTQDSGTGDQKRKATFSWWFKRGGSFGTEMIHVGAAASTRLLVRFDTSDRLVFRLTNSTTEYQKVTNRTFEDTSKWYHCHWQIDVSQSTATDRSKVWIDGDQITSWSSDSNPAQNTDVVGLSDGTTQRIGCGAHFVGQIFDGYLAEFNYCDGVITTVDNFGVTDTSTGRWIAKALTGITYGTNGFRLTFADSSAFGDDTSGNGNDFTATNLASTDQTTDSPTQNHMVFDANRNGGQTLSEGNLKLTMNASYKHVMGTMRLPKSGKFYWETTITTNVAKYRSIGIAPETHSLTDTSGTTDVRVIQVVLNDATRDGRPISWNNGHQDLGSSIGTMSNGTVVSWALDADNEKLYISIGDNNWKGFDTNASNPATGSNPVFKNVFKTTNWRPIATSYNNSTSHVFDWNFGQRTFANTVPSGFVALQQDNLPETDKGISGLSWIKDRDSSSHFNTLYDSSRGVMKELYSNSNSVEATQNNGLHKFLKGGFQTGDAVNTNTSGNSFVNWNWVANKGTTASNTDGSVTSTVQANTTAGFSIVQFTAPSAGNFTTGHGLSSTPEWVIVRMVNATSNWSVYHKSVYDASGNQFSASLNSTAAYSDLGSAIWGAGMTSSTLGLTSDGVVTAGAVSLAYAWHSVDGFSKFGSYSGNGNANGPFIQTNFKPAWLMVKRTDSAGYDWQIWDTKRSPINPITNQALFPNGTTAEGGTSVLDFLSNGFKWKSTGAWLNASGGIYIYMAFAEAPFIGDGVSPVTAR